LVDGETCSVAIAFRPSVAGAQHAMLHLGTTEVPLAAVGFTSAPGLVATLRNVAMLSGVLTTGSEVDFFIMNPPIATTGGHGLRSNPPAKFGPGVGEQSGFNAFYLDRHLVPDEVGLEEPSPSPEVTACASLIHFKARHLWHW
jgi:hypothetical protein